MQIKRFLNIILMSCSILMNNSDANKFIIGFYQNNNYDKYYITHNDIEYSTNNIEDFSTELKSIAKGYFSFSSISVDNNTKAMKLNNFNIFKEYELYLQSNIEYNPNIILNCTQNNLKLPSKISLNNINLLKIYSISYNGLEKNINNITDINVQDMNKILLNDKPIPIKDCTLTITNTQMTDINAISNIAEKLLYNTKPESVMDIMYFIWYVMKAPLKWIGLLK